MLIHECFDETLKRYGITGAALSRKVGVSPAHISQFRNGKGGAVSHTTLDEMLKAMDALAPGSKQYFCSQLAGVSLKSADWRSLITSATPQDIEEILRHLADRWAVIQSSKSREREFSYDREHRETATLAL